MSNNSLTTRLRQQSRGTGLATALVMATTLVLCIGGGIVIFGQLEPLTRDFVSANVTVTPGAVEQAQNGTSAGGSDAAPTDVPAGDDEPTAEPEENGGIVASDFVPTHISNDQDVVNYRQGPSAETARLAELAPGTELQETGSTESDLGGTLWREFVTADGLVGWIRDVDAIPV